MALRVTQNLIYSSSLTGMNNTLNALVESNIQSASQLKINRPSDDPAGAGRIVSLKASLNSMSVYQDNISTAKGWLATADSILSSSGSVQELLVKIQGLAEQGATGTLTAENREQISYELRECFDQLLNLANSTYAGKHIFSGTKTGTNAFVKGLGVTAIDSGTDLDGLTITASGGASATVLIQATSTDNAQDATYRYSEDGGKTWIDIPASDVLSNYPDSGKVTIMAGGVSVAMPMNVQVNAVDPDLDSSADNGTWLYVRPTAVYQGDDNDTQVVIPYGSTTNTSADISVAGTFSRDIAVRIDSDNGTELTYSYSLDDGNTWIQSTSPSGPPARLSVPGGYMTLDNVPAAGEQYIIHPNRADITLAISSTDSITLNLVGKDVFGGLCLNPSTGEYEIVDNGGNIFEVVGKLIAMAETNNQQGMADVLDQLTDCMNVVLTKAALVGGRENRLEMTEAALILRQYDEEDNLSNVQDVDIIELTMRLAQQELAYQSVLKSSSIIMQLSLINFI